MNFEQHVDRALTNFRWAWTFHAAIVGALLFVLLDGWWLAIIPVYLSLTYQLGILMVANHLVKNPPMELLEEDTTSEAMAKFNELNRRFEAGEVEPGPELYKELAEAGLALAVVEETGPVVGRYQDHDIFEWVEMYDATSGKKERFDFHEVAALDVDGTPTYEHVEGKRQAVVNGLIYIRDIQPAQAAPAE